jgi:hypothetical protein
MDAPAHTESAPVALDGAPSTPSALATSPPPHEAAILVSTPSTDVVAAIPTAAGASTVGVVSAGAPRGSVGSLAPQPNSAKSAKRKLEKEGKKLAWKALKKMKKEAREEAEEEAEGDEAEGAPVNAGNANGSKKRSGCVSTESIRETEYAPVECGVDASGNATASATTRAPYPYWFEFATYAKRRWVGRPVLEVLTGEYGK